MSNEIALSCDDVVAHLTDMPIHKLEALVAVGKGASSTRELWPVDERYWFSGTGGVKFTRAEDEAVRRCWTRVLQVIASQHADRDLHGRKPGRLMAWLDRIVQPRENVRAEGDAGGSLERIFGGDIWLAVTVIWNACCAALLATRLPDDLFASLESGWRLGHVGPTPYDQLRAMPPEDRPGQDGTAR